MRICIDLTSLADNFSGIERYAACITLELIRKYKEDSFILLFKREVHSIFEQIVNNKNVTIKILDKCNKLLFNQVRLPYALHKVKADWYLFLAFPTPILSFRRNMVETIHDITAWDCPETMNGMSKWYFKLSHLIAIKKCKAIITISDFSRGRINTVLKYPQEKIWLIYCGIDQNRFKTTVEQTEKVKNKYHLPSKYILSLSTLEPRKNLPLLIHAYGELISENHDLPYLVLAGRKGWGIDDLLSSIDDKVKSKIIITGFIDDEDIATVYSMAQLFVFPSKYEGFGIPPLEAMACGCPVLSSDAASLKEVCGDAAIYFHNDNIEDLKRQLIKSISENNEYYREKGFAQITKFNWQKEAESLYVHLVKKKEKNNENSNTSFR